MLVFTTFTPRAFGKEEHKRSLTDRSLSSMPVKIVLRIILVNALPSPVIAASSLPYKNSFLMIGGLDDGISGNWEGLATIYWFDPADNTFVPIEGVALGEARYWLQAMYVDAQALPKCE